MMTPSEVELKMRFPKPGGLNLVLIFAVGLALVWFVLIVLC